MDWAGSQGLGTGITLQVMGGSPKAKLNLVVPAAFTERRRELSSASLALAHRPAIPSLCSLKVMFALN